MIRLIQSAFNMASLNIFPIEVLDIISGQLKTADVGRLWMSGDRNVRFKLSNGGISVLSLSWSHAPTMPWPVPFLQSIKSLRTIEWRSVQEYPYCPSLDFTFLPPTLTRLCIHSIDVYCIMNAMNYKLDAMFPLLTHLDIDSQRVKAQNLKNLPKNLISLSLVSLHDYIEDNALFGDLPRSITELRLGMSVSDPFEHGNALPPILQKISIDTLEANYDWLKKLPRTVQHLRVGLPNQSNFASLPPGLQHLSLTENEPLDPDHIPPTLISLKFPIKGDISPSFWKKVPPTIRSVTASGVLDHEDLQLVPKTLTDLDMDTVVSHVDMISMFPPEIRSMTLYQRFDDPIILNPLPFPLKLTFLLVSYMNDALCQMLPPSLTSLTIRRGDITEIGGKCINRLPLLVNLLVSRNAIIDQVVPYLRSISKLTFGNFETFELHKLSHDFIHHLLPSSHDDKLITVPNRTSARLESSIVRDPLSNLLSEPERGNSISELQFSYTGRSTYDFASFQTVLPLFVRFTCLKSLTMTSMKHCIDPDFFQYLPPCLQSLYIVELSHFPTIQHLDFLPLALADLSFKVQQPPLDSEAFVCPWTDSDLAHLPRNLQSLHLNGRETHFTPDLINYIPPYLHEFLVNEAPLECFQSPLTRRFGPTEYETYYM